MSQDEIGWELGLIVPSDIKSEFKKVRTGPKPRTGYGTQTLKPQFSIEKYFVRNHLPLSIKRISVASTLELDTIIDSALKHDDNPVVNVYQKDAEFDKDGVPPHVKNYVAVDNYEESKVMALEMGATLIREVEVPDYCKLGVLKIPGDLFVAIVQYYKGHY
jgi:hypothetical protein